jgi:predicted glycosyltransferase
MELTTRPSPPALERDAPRSRNWRVALYSHDTMGLGHLRRNLLIAQTLAHSSLRVDVLMMSGAREACAYALPAGVDCLSLPGIGKGLDGSYHSRSLGIPLEELIAMRANAMRAALDAFEPDVLIVDNVPRGAMGELASTLTHLRARGRTRCVLGLRDVLDDPAVVHQEWRRMGNEETIRECYDTVWVYGDPAIYDPVREYRLPPEIASKVRYAGYLDQRARLRFAEVEGSGPVSCPLPAAERFALCMVGGGQDGARLAEAFAHAELPAEMAGVIVTGPYMPPEVQQRLRRRAAANLRLHVLNFVSEPTQLLSRADRVIAMGGYNTVCEVLSFEKHALIVPRVQPRLEQWIRAQRLRDLGLIDLLHPEEVSPNALSHWLAGGPSPARRIRDRIDLDGLARLPHLLEEILTEPAFPAATAHSTPRWTPAREVQYVVG